MKVGTDGVLLGAWVSLTNREKRILDIGTGTGVIALMLAQRTEGYRPSVDAVEVEPEAAGEAFVNFERSPWADRLRVIPGSIQPYAKASSPGMYDLIVSNPPYFQAGLDFRRGKGWDVSPSATVPTPERIAARHAEMLPYEELIAAVAYLLEPTQGRFAAIFPVSEFGIFVAAAEKAGLYVHRKLEVKGTPQKGVKRVAAEFSLNKPVGEMVRQDLYIERGKPQEYSEEYMALTREFYLYF